MLGLYIERPNAVNECKNVKKDFDNPFNSRVPPIDQTWFSSRSLYVGKHQLKAWHMAFFFDPGAALLAPSVMDLNGKKGQSSSVKSQGFSTSQKWSVQIILVRMELETYSQTMWNCETNPTSLRIASLTGSLVTINIEQASASLVQLKHLWLWLWFNN